MYMLPRMNVNCKKISIYKYPIHLKNLDGISKENGKENYRKIHWKVSLFLSLSFFLSFSSLLSSLIIFIYILIHINAFPSLKYNFLPTVFFICVDMLYYMYMMIIIFSYIIS